MKKLSVLFLSFLFFSAVQAQDNLMPDEYFYKASNGLNVFFISDAGEANSIVSLTFDSGTYIQHEGLKGSVVFYNKLLAALLNEKFVDNSAQLVRNQANQSSSTFVFSVNKDKIGTFFKSS